MGEVVNAEEGGSILIFNCDVLHSELIPCPITTRLGTADEFGHGNNKLLRVGMR